MVRPDFSGRARHGASRGRSRLLFATVLIICVFALDALLGGPFRNFVRSVASHAWTGVGSVGASITGSGVFARNSTLARENQRLTQELEQVRERAAAYDALKAENETLRTMLHFSETAPGVTAPVVSSYHASPYGTFMVAAGADDAIAPGDLVLSESGYVVGRVADVGETRTLVRSVFQAGSTLDIVVGNAAVSAIGEGTGIGAPRHRYQDRGSGHVAARGRSSGRHRRTG